MRLMKMSILAAVAATAVMAVSASAASAAWKPAGDEVAISGHLKFGEGWAIDCDVADTATLKNPASTTLLSSSPVLGACDIMYGTFPYPIGHATFSNATWTFTDTGKKGVVTAGFPYVNISTDMGCSISVSKSSLITGAWTNGTVVKGVVTPGKLTFNEASGVYFEGSGGTCPGGNYLVTGSLEFSDLTHPAQAVTVG